VLRSTLKRSTRICSTQVCCHCRALLIPNLILLSSLTNAEFPGAEDAPIADASGLAKMDIKKFSRVLNAKLLDASHVLGCTFYSADARGRMSHSHCELDMTGITEHHAFVVYVKLKRDLGTATFYIPLLAQ